MPEPRPWYWCAEEITRVAGLILRSANKDLQRIGSSSLPPTDAELVRRIRAGDQEAFRELVDRHSDSLFGLACTLVGSPADAEDLLQETFLGAFRRLGAFEGRSAVKTWLVRILLNHVSKLRRSKRVRRATSLEEQVHSEQADRRLQSRSPAAAVESHLDVSAMLQALSPEHREILALRELQQMSYDEIAEVLRIPRGTVESRLHRARQELKKRYAGYLT